MCLGYHSDTRLCPTAGIYFLIVLEVRSPRSRCWRVGVWTSCPGSRQPPSLSPVSFLVRFLLSSEHQSYWTKCPPRPYLTLITFIKSFFQRLSCGTEDFNILWIWGEEAGETHNSVHDILLSGHPVLTFSHINMTIHSIPTAPES